MIANQSSFRRKLRSLALRLLNHLENNGDANFEVNGEKLFLKNLVEYLKKSDSQGEVVFFDVGANTGEYCQLLLDEATQISTRAKVHVFEPTEACFETLQHKFQKINQVILNKKAASNSNGTAKIFYDQQKSGLASLYKRNLNTYSIFLDQSDLVETVRLDEYIEQIKLKHIHFLKVDIEGHEMAAFEGLGSYLAGDFIDFVQFEYGGANLDSHSSLVEFYTLFEKAGFVLAKVMRKGLDIRSYQPWMDNFQYANYIAISKNIVDQL